MSAPFSVFFFKTDMPDEGGGYLFEALKTETSRVKYSIQLAERQLSEFEKKYGGASKEFIREWWLKIWKHLEYVKWSGVFHLATRLDEPLHALESLKNVPS